MFITAHVLVQEAKKSVHECDAAEMHARMSAPHAVLIDVREPDEYRQGHISGAINIPRGMLEFKISNEPSLQDTARPLLVYCKTSGRAALSVVALQAMGFTNASSLAGGFDGWIAAGHPVSQPKDLTFE